MITLTNNNFIIDSKQTDIKQKYFKYIGRDVKIWPLAKLINCKNISIGHRSIIDDFCLIMAPEEPIVIGKFVHFASFCSITGNGGLIMEDFSGLAAGVRISTSDEDYGGGSCLTNPSILSEYRKIFSKKVHIKKHAIIGTNTVILPGVTIGEGCAVGANSLITKDLEPWTINVGSPTKVIRKRPHKKIFEMENHLFVKYPEYK